MFASPLSFAVLFSCMGGVYLINVKTPQKFVNVTTGSSVSLECTFTTSEPTTKLNIQWNFNQKSRMVPQLVYYYLSGEAEVQGNFKGRVVMPRSPNVTKNASITINDMKPSDSGVYTCEVHNFPDAEGRTEGSIMVNVLEKPSKPFCAVHGTVESGHLVSLTCHTERGNPTPTYTWTKLNQGKTRSARGSTDLQTGILHIRNLSEFEFGEYQCNASNSIGFSTCTVELTEELGDGAIAGAVIGSLLASALVLFLVWFIVHKIKKQKYKAAKAAGGTEMQTGPTSSDSVKYASIPIKDTAPQAPSNPEPPPQEASTPSPEGEGLAEA